MAESGVDQLWEFGDGAATDAEDTSDADEDAQETSDENKSKASAKTKKKKKDVKAKDKDKKGCAKAHSKRKSTPADIKNRVGVCCMNWCDTAPEPVTLPSKQPSCESCTNDLTTMRRDAKRVGKQAVKFIKEMELEHKKDKPQGLNKLHKAWKEAVGDSMTSRIGKFDWARHEERYVVLAGREEKDEEVPQTHHQYLQHLQTLGLSEAAAKRKLSHKLADPSTEHGKCAESDLPTIMVAIGTRKSKMVQRFKEQGVSRGTKEIKNPSQEAMAEMVDDLDLNMPSISQSSRFNAFTGDKPGMAALVTGSSVTLQEEMWSLEGLDAASKEDKKSSTDKNKPDKVDPSFDPVSDAAEAKNAVRKDHADMVTAVKKCSEDTESIITQIGGNSNYFEDTLPALKKRHSLLHAVIAGSSK